MKGKGKEIFGDSPIEEMSFSYSVVFLALEVDIWYRSFLRTGPFLATRCLKQLAEDEGSALSKDARVLKNDFYVDDLFTGADTVEKAKHLRDELIQLTNKRKLRTRKWVSNSSYLTEDLPDDSNNIRLKIDPDKCAKALGVFWNSAEDTFTFDVHVKPDESIITKRVILSEIAQLYDPLRLVAPVIVYAKIQMQELWKLKLGWDDPVPINIITLWE
ncbi:uncharacterized protein LOC117181087 [Belonocnema kinseyi]|uniref:uncharacterized protein LOC117181087 n=1 Tax=Belonocnema kinseyi TaxID=2817044 RepID=UPI00143D01DF|nr:uncharacterized protein LOC117181087 [Belonocnema kinseyi]